jgi:Cdc6-like AAA superfamily ATPase
MTYFEQVESILENLTGSYHRLIVIVGRQGVGKTELIRNLVSKLQWPQVNLNLMLSEALMPYQQQKRPVVVSSLFYEFFETESLGYLIDNTELLFDKSLKINPIYLLKNVSRNRTIVCSLNGQMNGNDFIYAETNHPEYFRETLNDINIIDLNTSERNPHEIQ